MHALLHISNLVPTLCAARVDELLNITCYIADAIAWAAYSDRSVCLSVCRVVYCGLTLQDAYSVSYPTLNTKTGVEMGP